MPRWIARLIWAMRGKRRVRLHLTTPGGFEGLLVGRWSGHYVLLAASWLENEGQSYPVDGHAEIPAERVLWVQVMP